MLFWQPFLGNIFIGVGGNYPILPLWHPEEDVLSGKSSVSTPFSLLNSHLRIDLAWSRATTRWKVEAMINNLNFMKHGGLTLFPTQFLSMLSFRIFWNCRMVTLQCIMNCIMAAQWCVIHRPENGFWYFSYFSESFYCLCEQKFVLTFISIWNLFSQIVDKIYGLQSVKVSDW